MIADKDLLSIQQARILAENAFAAQKRLALFSQEKLDAIVECVADEVEKHVKALAVMSHEETDYGRTDDKLFKNRFVCGRVREELRGMRCVGVLEEDHQKHLLKIGVPMGVILALCPVTSPVSTTIYKSLLAIKSGNAIIFSPHPGALKSIVHVLDIIIRTAQSCGLPVGCISYLDTVTKSGTCELINHPAISLVLMTGVPGMFEATRCSGKPVIYGGMGNGPAFIERTADIRQAACDIVRSKLFDNGIAPSAEQSVVVDGCVEKEVRKAFRDHGAFFLSEEESYKLADHLFCRDGSHKRGMVGVSAHTLAKRAGLNVPEYAKVLIAERKYVSESDPYSRELLAPVLAYYVEDDWRFACEKCIELLLHERNGHSLVIHSRDEDVIMQFALKKPVGRLLVNTPASFGGMGATTNLFPALTLGSGVTGYGITSDNVSPLNLVYTRTVGYGVRNIDGAERETPHLENACASAEGQSRKMDALQQLLLEAVTALSNGSK